MDGKDSVPKGSESKFPARRELGPGPQWRIFAIYPIFHGYWILRGVWKIGWGDFQACATFSFLGIRFHVLGPQVLIANEPVTPACGIDWSLTTSLPLVASIALRRTITFPWQISYRFSH